MAKRSVSVVQQTQTAFADANGMTDSNYPFYVKGGSGTQRVKISEIKITGLSQANAPCVILGARDSTVAGTPAAGTVFDAILDASGEAVANVVVVGNSATTDPQRSATLHLIDMSMNLFGGIFRWWVPDGSEVVVLGNTASLGEFSVSTQSIITGTAVLSGHLIYEPA
jgi:hypothetical protein